MTLVRKCDVSVIIPAYSAEDHIERSINSVFKQTVLPNEIIVVDDGSEDGTWLTLSEIAKRQNPTILKIFSKSHGGPGAARNLAIRNSSSYYLAFLDADDEWLPTKLEETMRYMGDNSYDLVAHNVLMVEGRVEKKNNISSRYSKSLGQLYYGLYCRGFLATSTVIVPVSLVKKVGGFDETLDAGQDFELWLNILSKKESRFLVFESYLTKYHVRSGSVTRNAKLRLECTIEIAKRYAPLLSTHNSSIYRGFLFRMAAIHYEAMCSYLSKNNPLLAIGVLIKFPFRLLFEFFILLKSLK